MLGFFAAFAVKLPAVPLHTWLPDAHTEAPTGGSVILAGLLLKTGAYGLLRLGVPLFPAAAVQMAPVAMTLGVIGILYGAVTALGQTDVKRLVAYTSVSHLGFALLGIYAWNGLALQGVVMELVCHGLSTGGLFVVAGLLQERLHTRDMDRMGGLWRRFPRAGGLAMILALASLGLPGLGNFVGEILILLGAYQANPGLAAVATLGLVVAAAYALAMIQRVFHGPPSASGGVTRDLVPREALVLGLAVTLLLWLGFYPGPVLEMVEPSMDHLRGVSQVTSGLASAAWGAP
jgi:NADH-quinone oxidoreductase subunit M